MTADATPALDFLRDYERRTNTHDPDQVVEVIAEDATYWFSDGAHRGRPAIRAAIAATWETIQDETYEVRDVEMVAAADDLAVFRYTFHWSGLIRGEAASGSGRGTNVAVRRDGSWQMVHEHLS